MKVTRRNMCQSLALTLVATAAMAAPVMSVAQNYPTKPIKAIVPFPPGGGGDTLGRLVLTKVGDEIKQPVVVENLPGAGGNLGAAAAARAQADGYTLLYGTNGTHAINSSLYKKTGFDALKDFIPISRLTEIAAIVSVRPDLPVSNVKELIDYSKKSGVPLNFGSAGNGTTSHLAGEMFKQVTGVNWMHVPYKGGAAALTDLMAGRIDVLIDVAPNLGPHVGGGRIKALAVTTKDRVKAFEKLPTVIESGVPDYVVTAWDGLFVPAKTDAAIVNKLTAAVNQALKNPELKAQLEARVATPSPLNNDQFRAFIVAETQRWAGVVKKSGASVD